MFKIPRLFSTLIIVIFFSLACQMPAVAPTPTAPVSIPGVPESPTSSPVSRQVDKSCGDGVCNGPENPKNCPADCGNLSGQPEESIPNTNSAQVQEPAKGDGVLYVGLMVHLEGWNDDQNQKSFEEHVRLLREYASLFETYGAKLTLESKELTGGSIKWGDNVLLEMQQRGHGIGVHADTGGEKNMDCSQMTGILSQKKSELESLGVTVRHVSGNVSSCDWVTSSIDAGYLFTTGVVAYGLQSLPAAQRPEQFRFCASPAACHDSFPLELEGRLHPWRANSGSDWPTHSDNGRLVILPSNNGLSCFSEEQAEGKSSQTKCDYSQEDIDGYFKELEQALTLTRKDQVNIYYNSWSLGKALDKGLLEEWLKRLQPYVNSGKIEWKTLPEMYDSYIVWEEKS